MAKNNRIVGVLFVAFVLMVILTFFIWYFEMFNIKMRYRFFGDNLSVSLTSLTILLVMSLIAISPESFEKFLDRINLLKLPNLIKNKKERLLIYKSFGYAGAIFGFFVFIVALILWLVYDVIGV